MLILINIKIFGIMETIVKKPKNEGYIIYGRSDATLNAGGVRFGTAELYRVVENLNDIMECVAVEHNIQTDTEVIFLLK